MRPSRAPDVAATLSNEGGGLVKLTCLTDRLLLLHLLLHLSESKKETQLLTRESRQHLKCLQELQPDAGLVLQSGHGEDQRLCHVTQLQQLQPVPWRCLLEPCRGKKNHTVDDHDQTHHKQIYSISSRLQCYTHQKFFINLLAG